MAKRRAAIRKKIDFFAVFAGIAFSAAALAARAQTADQAWLALHAARHHTAFLFRCVPSAQIPMERTAAAGTQRGILPCSTGVSSAETANPRKAKPSSARLDEVRKAYPQACRSGATLASRILGSFAATLKHGHPLVIVAGSNEHGALFGAFDLLRRIATECQPSVTSTYDRQPPAMPIRWVDEWDNANGTVERGYGGRSIFFENGHVRDDLSQVSEYARLLASVGINGCNVNNVNGAAPFLTPDMIKGLARIADAMRPWGVRLAMSVDIASPQKIGGLKTFDPLDPAVKAWWAAKVNEIYQQIPDLAGFTVKADSEGQPGPASYGRSPADAANVLAAALAPHGGVVLYRAFVYNNHLDYNDLKADRARAAYDIFHPLDGQFAAQRHRANQIRPHRLPGARSRSRRSSPASTKPTRPWNCRSRRSISASSATSSTSRPCGSEYSTSICARKIVRRR